MGRKSVKKTREVLCNPKGVTTMANFIKPKKKKSPKVKVKKRK